MIRVTSVLELHNWNVFDVRHMNTITFLRGRNLSSRLGISQVFQVHSICSCVSKCELGGCLHRNEC